MEWLTTFAVAYLVIGLISARFSPLKPGWKIFAKAALTKPVKFVIDLIAGILDFVILGVQLFRYGDQYPEEEGIAMPDLMWYWWALIALGSICFIANLWSTQVLFDMEDDWSFPMFILFLFIGWPIYMAIILFGVENPRKG